MFRLDGRRALVTGAGRGIGLAIGRAMADAGAEVTFCARSRDEVEAKRGEGSAMLGDACRGHDILYSTRILKKTGLRLRDE